MGCYSFSVPRASSVFPPNGSRLPALGKGEAWGPYNLVSQTRTKLNHRVTHTGGGSSEGWGKMAPRCIKTYERGWCTHSWFILPWAGENSTHVCLPCVASRIARRQESWRLCVASCALQLATHLLGPLFLADEWLDQGPAKSISWSDMARVKQEMPGQHRIGPSTPISTGWWLYISSQLLWLLGVFSL